ncbi:MAG: ATP-binding cassette domain-containing protein [Vagococcus sp.]|uniref:energy-coupling factor ABC transporter ATP-binding protein n=1 Tax=Vagococcus sp. TaxID=1933889 RepID=UPI002FC8F3D7
MKEAIVFDNVSYRYSSDSEWALENASITVNTGESLAIIGENGAGKSTFAKLCCGLFKPEQGSVLINSQEVYTMKNQEKAKLIGYVFQNPDDQIFLSTVGKEIIYPHKTYEDNAFFKEVIALCSLEDELDSHPYNLPWSTRKFVTIASIILQKPHYIIFDEPTAGQEKKGKEILKNILNYLKEKKITVLMISHDMEFVAENFQRAIVLKDKSIIKDDQINHIFYDQELLQSAGLDQPFVPKLLSSLANFDNGALTMEELAKQL